MTEEKMKGKFNETVGGAREKAGEWTGDEESRSEGQAQEMKGKAQGMWGDAKEKAEDVGEDIKEKVSGD
jgi:uncharacterized protein YjbJ (UPF0337 family)